MLGVDHGWYVVTAIRVVGIARAGILGILHLLSPLSVKDHRAVLGELCTGKLSGGLCAEAQCLDVVILAADGEAHVCQ